MGAGIAAARKKTRSAEAAGEEKNANWSGDRSQFGAYAARCGLRDSEPVFSNYQDAIRLENGIKSTSRVCIQAVSIVYSLLERKLAFNAFSFRLYIFYFPLEKTFI